MIAVHRRSGCSIHVAEVELDTLFEFGMQRLLDGLGVFFERAWKQL